MSYVLGCVPYVNARPLVRAFAESPDVEVRYDVPSKLPAMLDCNRADAVLASSFDALKTPGRRFAAGVSISSLGAVQSVRLFSKNPLGKIASLALDQSSLTSNALAQILLAEKWGCAPDFVSMLPNLDLMLQTNDAALLIGDLGMSASANGLHVMDLGETWSVWTNLPFVWALWIGEDGLTPDLSKRLQEAARWGEAHLEQIAEESAEATGWTVAVCDKYLRESIDFELREEHLRGLELFQKLLVKHGLVPDLPFPETVESGSTVAGVSPA